jgi:hypothetical protein
MKIGQPYRPNRVVTCRRCTHNEEIKPMARKPNYEFERRERDRLKAIKNAEKAAAKKEAKERAKAEADGAAPTVDPDEKA